MGDFTIVFLVQFVSGVLVATHQEDIQVNLLQMRNLGTKIDPKKEWSRRWQIQSLKRTG
jgi:hypothetical protein